jgi:hypothetical protein
MFESLSNPLLVAIYGLSGTVLIGVITNAVWDYVKNTYSYTSSAWPKLSGEWKVTRELGELGDSDDRERVIVKHQFGPKFRAELRTPTDNGKDIVQLINGEFLDKYHALYTIRQITNDYTEMGAGMLMIGTNNRIATGKSVYFGETTEGDVLAATYKIEKL